MLTMPADDNQSITREAVLRSELKALTEEQVAMDKYRSYFDGEQPLVYSTDLFHEVFGDAFEGFKDNWMKVIINACNSRIRLMNFHFENDEGSELAKQIWDVLRLNEIDVQQRDLHEGTMVESRGFIIVWPDPDLGAIVDWQPGQLCRVFYDPDRRTQALWAVKRWLTDHGDIYVTFYTPDFVYKFRDTSAGKQRSDKSHSSSSALKEIPDVGWFGNLEEREISGEEWPLPNPFGRVPLVEFNNTSYKSDLEDAIPQQDALNKTLLDMMVTGEFQAFKQRLIETMSAEPEGGWRAGAGEVWAMRPSFDADGKHIPTQIHTFETSDPSTYMRPIEMWLQHMALTSSTPVRYFMQSDRGGRGDSPSGDSLLVDDKPLNDKVEEKQLRWGNRWMEVARLIAAALEEEDPYTLVGDAVWQDPRHDFILSKLKEGQAMIEIGIPIEFVVTKIGLTPDEEIEVLRLVEEAKKEQEAKEQAELAAAAAAVTAEPSSDS